MRTELQGWYAPTPEELDALWSDRSIFALDASTLLYPYRVPDAARRQLLDLLAHFQDQLWCPYQAALEYQRNRLTVIADQAAAYEDLEKRLESARQSLTQLRAEHPTLDAREFERRVARSIDGLARWVAEVRKGHPQYLGRNGDDDLVRDDWDQLLAGRVGARLAIDDEWEKAAQARYDAEQPPGFCDSKKPPDRRFGDLIIWEELLGEVERRGESPVPVLLIIDDRKPDWWRKHKAERLGPRPELVEEIQLRGGGPFWMYSVSRFIETAADRLGWELEAATEASVDLDEAPDERPRSGREEASGHEEPADRAEDDATDRHSPDEGEAQAEHR